MPHCYFAGDICLLCETQTPIYLASNCAGTLRHTVLGWLDCFLLHSVVGLFAVLFFTEGRNT